MTVAQQFTAGIKSYEYNQSVKRTAESTNNGSIVRFTDSFLKTKSIPSDKSLG